MSTAKISDTKVINLYGAPSSGKSTLAAYTFSKLKQERPHLNVELVTEFAKQLTWSNRHEDLKCQPYIFGKQLNRMWNLLNKVDVIITDSPLLLGLLYTDEKVWPTSFRQSMLDISNMFNNINFYLHRVKSYNPVGRNQTEKESDVIGNQIKDMLHSNRIRCDYIEGKLESYELILSTLEWMS